MTRLKRKAPDSEPRLRRKIQLTASQQAEYANAEQREDDRTTREWDESRLAFYTLASELDTLSNSERAKRRSLVVRCHEGCPLLELFPQPHPLGWDRPMSLVVGHTLKGVAHGAWLDWPFSDDSVVLQWFWPTSCAHRPGERMRVTSVSVIAEPEFLKDRTIILRPETSLQEHAERLLADARASAMLRDDKFR